MLAAKLSAKKKPNHRAYYAYDVEFDGDLIVESSRDPEHDLARALLARGIKGAVTLHDASTGKPRTIINIEKAARWRVEDGKTALRCQRYRETGDSATPTAEDDLVLPTAPWDVDAA
jgi:hypothetical protein